MLGKVSHKQDAVILDRFPLVLEHVVRHHASRPYQLGVGEVGPSKRGTSLHLTMCVCSNKHRERATKKRDAKAILLGEVVNFQAQQHIKCRIAYSVVDNTACDSLAA